MQSGYYYVCILLVSAVIVACGKSADSKPTHNNSNLAIQSTPSKARDEQAVLLYIKLSDDKFGTAGERDTLMELGDQLAKLTDNSPAGEYDGHEYGEGYCTFYLYGPDANLLYEAIRPTLTQRKNRPKSYAIKRFGPPGSKEERFDL